jgi:replicative DNA helicase
MMQQLDADLIPVDAEEIIMGQVLMCSTMITTAASMLKPEHFGHPPCRTVYSACINLWRQGIGVDLLTVTMELKRTNSLDTIGGPVVPSKWTNRVASTKHFADHAEIVRSYYGMRVLRQAGEGLIRGIAPGEDPASLLPALTEAMGRASMADTEQDVKTGDHAAKMMDGHERPKPIYLGCESVDSMVFILPGNVVTVKAPAGVGKTAAILSWVLNLLPVRKTWFVSLEMSADELTMRALCQLAGVDIDRVMEDRLSQDERDRMAKMAITHADTLNRMDVDDSGQITVDELMAKAEHKVTVDDVGLIVIDYAQLVTGNGDNDVSRLKSVSMGIRAMARKLSVPVILVVHVNKAGQEEGTIQFEKDAHVRLSLSREPGAPTMDVDIQKNRNGRTGSVSTPCYMAHGIVGRNGPPSWVARDVPHPPFNPRIPSPNNRIEPNDETAPF